MITIGESERFAALRHRMVETQLRARDIRDERVLQAMARVPRHQFAPEQYRGQAYEDHPLPIGEGQTISQPYMVALMLDFLELRPADRALEVGTGSGYVTALLAELALHVVSVERHAALANDARMLLAVMGYSNVTVIVGDGSRGWPDFAPYDAIIVSAAASAVPPDLVAQLAEGGRMIIPVGGSDTQQLLLIRKQNGEAVVSTHGLCRFVPLIAGAETESTS
jgi:protein-L-isoaspartate(D-aspartate) O-methyltransferase